MRKTVLIDTALRGLGWRAQGARAGLWRQGWEGPGPGLWIERIGKLGAVWWGEGMVGEGRALCIF